MSDIGIIESLTRRVEELEKAPPHGIQQLLLELRPVFASWSEFFKLDERISKLEGAAMSQQPEKPLIDPFIIERQVGVALRLKSVSSENDHHCYIDPEASPSGIPFEVALMYAKHGRKVMMADDPHQDVFEVRDGRFMGSHRHSVVSIQEVMSNAWLVLPKEEKP